MSELKQLQNALKNGRISRRDFIQRMSALGAAVAIPGSLLSGSVFAAEPKKGGHFKMGVGSGSTSDSLDPATYDAVFNQSMGHAHHNYLMEINNKGEAIPELAASMEPDADAKVWTVKLRESVTFHNGKELEADDVIASYNHHRGEDSTSGAKELVKQIKDIRADGKNTVVFELEGGNADFPYITTGYHLPIMPSKDGAVADANSGIGAGAFVVEDFEPGVRCTFKNNPNYWKSDRGHFDSAEIISIKDVVARTNALTTGEIHAMDRCDLKTVHLLQRNKKIEVTKVTGTQHYTMPMHVDVAPFDNLDVRLALKYAIDRQGIIDTVLRGFGEIGNDHPIGPGQRFFNKDLEQRQYDPDKAKFHLKQAGMENLKVDFSTSEAAFGGAVDSAILFKEHAAKASIDVNVIREPDDGYWSNVWLVKPFCMVYWGGRPTEDWMFTTTYAEGAEWNESHWANPRFNELLVAARAELDENKRREMYYEMQQLCRDDGGTIVPIFASYVSAISTDVGHGELSSNWDMDGNRALERWWMA